MLKLCFTHFPAHLQPDRRVEISPRLKAGGSQFESDFESFIRSVMDFFPGLAAGPQMVTRWLLHSKKKIFPYEMTAVNKSQKDKM